MVLAESMLFAYEKKNIKVLSYISSCLVFLKILQTALFIVFFYSLSINKRKSNTKAGFEKHKCNVPHPTNPNAFPAALFSEQAYYDGILNCERKSNRVSGAS